MLNIVFPENTGQRYYKIHFEYILKILQRLCSVTFKPTDDFIIEVNGKSFLIDYWDNPFRTIATDLPCFKFHCTEEANKLFAFTPVSFYDWDLYEKLKSEIKYLAKGHIACRQRPYGAALSRRSYVHRLLNSKFDNVEIGQLDYNGFLNDINKCLVSVCVPGYCNTMCDRGQIQYMAFGCCTISPNLPEILPFNHRIIPNEHYIQCKEDYTDLVEKINWCKKNVDKCIEIGQNAKRLFEETSTPDKLIQWITSKL